MPTRDEPRASAGSLGLDQLYREHADFVWRVVLRFGIDEAQAEDVVHEVFLVVDRRLGDYIPGAPMRAWIYGIARGVAANVRRSRQRAEQRLRVVPRPPDPETPEQQMERQQAVSLVESFLATLSPAQREVFVLIDIEGMTGPQVSDAVGAKLNSVYSRLRLARARFVEFVARVDYTNPTTETCT